MNIRVNVPILKRHVGDIVTPQDSDYLQFEAWAENKDRKFGQEICEVIPEKVKAKEPEKVIEEAKEPEKAPIINPEPDKAFPCDVEGCGKIFGSAAAVRMHKMNGHKAAKPEESNGN